MITSNYLQLMAQYNRWQNESLYSAADALGDEVRRENRGAFFRSIHETLCHILWADKIWMSRFSDYPAPAGGIPSSTALHVDWTPLCDDRRATDEAILDWAAGVTDEMLKDDLTWFSGATGRELSRPRWLLYAHFFNHQTHHRGQVHAMLTAAGARPDDTDIAFMPGL